MIEKVIKFELINNLLSMKHFFKNNLPDTFVKDNDDDGAFKLDIGCISTSINIKKSHFSNGNDQWVYTMLLGVLDKYSSIGQQGYFNCVVDTSIVDEEVVLLDTWDVIQHWDLGDEIGLLKTLKETAIPWLEKFTQPQLVIDYLIAIEASANGEITEVSKLKFGQLISLNINLPKRVKQSFNGAVATIYDSVGIYDKALLHLNQHKAFVLADLSPKCKVQSMIDNHHKSVKLIDDGIYELSNKL